MSIEVKCPNRDCDQLLMLSPEMAGRKGQCPKCGKAFQIPKNLGAGRTQAGGAKTGRQTSAGGGSSGAQPSPRRRQQNVMSSAELQDYLVPEEEAGPTDSDMPVVEVEADVAADYEAVDYEAPPRAARGRRAQFDYEAEDEDENLGIARAKTGMSKTRKRKLLSAGFMIVAISTCVFGGSLGLSFLAEAFGEIAGAARSPSLGNAAYNFLRISQVFCFIASLGLVTGYVFCLFVPNKHASLGLIIATLSVGAVNMVLRLVFRMIYVFVKEYLFYDRSWFAVNGGHGVDAGPGILLMFMELSFCAEIMLMAMFLAAVARMQHDRVQRRDCMRVVWFMTGVASVVFLESIFLMIHFTEDWPRYVIRVMNWGANGVLGIAFVFHIMNLFHARRSTA